jgi:hypothetical protein
MSAVTYTDEKQQSVFGKILAEIAGFLDLFSAARRISAATRSGKKPSDADLRMLGIDPAQFPRIV